MATKDEIASGLQMLIQEARRIAGAFSEDDWARAHDMDGWRNKETLAHIAAVGGMVQPMVAGLANAPEGANPGAGIDIDALNAATVGQRKDKSVQELTDEIATAYSGVIDFVRAAPQEQLDHIVSFRGYENVPISELLMRMVVLHGLAHIYSAYSAVFDSKPAVPAR